LIAKGFIRNKLVLTVSGGDDIMGSMESKDSEKESRPPILDYLTKNGNSEMKWDYNPPIFHDSVKDADLVAGDLIYLPKQNRVWLIKSVTGCLVDATEVIEGPKFPSFAWLKRLFIKPKYRPFELASGETFIKIIPL
jgi:hypothetical protein